jgi:hypothetical protein
MTEPDEEADADPRGLIREAYRMDLGAAECRSILLDWALGQPVAGRAEIARLLVTYGAAQPDHPMTAVLREGLVRAPRDRPRWRGRRLTRW